MQDNVESEKNENFTEMQPLQSEENAAAVKQMSSKDSSSAAAQPETTIEIKCSSNLNYGLNESPGWQLTLLMGFQHFIMMSSGSAFSVMLLFSPGCIVDSGDRSDLIAATFFVMGLATLLQTILGTRLPIVQGPSIAYYPAALAILSSFGSCDNANAAVSANATSAAAAAAAAGNSSTSAAAGWSSSSYSKEWHMRVSAAGGSLALGSLLQIIIGFSGVMSVMLQFIGPLVVAPTIFLIAISLLDAVVGMCSSHWYIALLTTLLVVVFTYVLDRMQLPIPYFAFKEKKMRTARIAIFSSLPILLSVVITYLICWILTRSELLPNDKNAWGYAARTDVRSDAIIAANWIRLPHPFQFGPLTLSGLGVVSVCIGVLVSVMESLGDYITAAALCEAPNPVGFPLNRGVSAEGVGCTIAGLFGIPLGVTSYSGNIAAISMTKIGSRRVIQVTGLILLVFGLFPKLSSLFVCVPTPVIGGVMLPAMSVICGIATANLQSVKMDRPRNAFVFGFSLFFGIVLPMYMRKAYSESVAAKAETIAGTALQLVHRLLMNEMLVGSMSALVLDNVLPGTQEDRGMIAWTAAVKKSSDADSKKQADVYDLPLLQRLVQRFPAIMHLPVCPTAAAMK